MYTLSRMTGRLALALALALPIAVQAQTPEASKAPPPPAVQDTAKQLLAKFNHWHPVGATGDGGIIDQNVDAAKRVKRLLHHMADVRLLADIPNECQPTPPLRLDLLSRAMHIVPVDGLFVRWKGCRIAPCASHDDIGTCGG